MKTYRQGDVLLIQVGNIPKGAKDITPEGRIILAYGEVTGHAHAIEPHKAKLWDAGAARFLQVIEKTALQHEEHGEVPLAPGIYRQAFQTEERGEEVRRVAD